MERKIEISQEEAVILRSALSKEEWQERTGIATDKKERLEVIAKLYGKIANL